MGTAEDTALRLWAAMMDDGGGGDGGGGGGAPPGSPPTRMSPRVATSFAHTTGQFTGPWFSTQLTLSLTLGLSSFLLFCVLRTRWDVVYMGRTKLQDFSPSTAHLPSDQETQGKPGSRLFGWILPTLRTSEFTVLQTVGLDAAVLLNFFKMSFILFSLCSVLAAAVLMPYNFMRHGSTDAEPDDPTFPPNSTLWSFPANTTAPSLPELILNPQTSATVNLIFTYIFTFLVLSLLHRNFHRFVRARQSFALHLIHSVSARTVLVTQLPSHLRGDRALAEYFEDCGWTVESVSVCREVAPLKRALKRRTDALMQLESAWAEWVGNPASPAVSGYDPHVYSRPVSPRLVDSPTQSTAQLVQVDESVSTSPAASRSASMADPEDGGDPHAHVHTTRPRPTFRPRWFGGRVDAITHWEHKYREADAEVRELRRTGQFPATHAAFVTLEDVKDAVGSHCQLR